MQLVAERLKGCRLRKGWNQEQLAEKAGVSLRSINSWESGENASAQNLSKLSAALGVTIAFLLGEDGTSPQSAEAIAKESGPYDNPKMEGIRREAHEYLDHVFDLCGNDEGEFYWVLGELKRRIYAREPSKLADPQEEPSSSSLTNRDIIKHAARAASSQKRKALGHPPHHGTS